MKQYDTYLFDWDGTILQTIDIWLDVMQQCYAEQGKQFTKPQIMSHLGDWDMPKHLGLTAAETAVYEKRLMEMAPRRLPEATLYDGALEILRALKGSGKQLGLVTSSRRENIDMFIYHHEMGDMFDIIITADDDLLHKPSPEPLLACMKHLASKPETTVMIGDNEKDLLAAAAAGIDSIWFYPPAHAELYDRQVFMEKYRPTHVIEALAEIA